MKNTQHTYLAELVMQVQHDNLDAFSELYSLTYNKVYNYAYHYLHDKFLAQDAVQEIFISVLKNISKLMDPNLFIAWLNPICFHVCYDIAKKRKDCCDFYENSFLELLHDVASENNPEFIIFQKDESYRLANAIHALPLHEQNVIILRYFNNLKLNDIATSMEISISSVKRYLSSGQTHLKEVFKE